ncbi:PaaI family thioesterase [uncultured Anaerococcus sp.]|uniref:PaaI family thioesterase n=1 Tax=uncultured Anaerococcus sp. TaxID=293428 RepID=UPI00262F9EF7|nr:PaaI family thioesterase [uncultured Anaerococcus sp.]
MIFSDFLNIEFLEFDDDHAKARMPLKKELANNIHSLHGGITASIIDSVSGYLASSRKIMTPTNNMSIYYFNPIIVEEGKFVYAEAKVMKRGKKIIVVDCEIYDDDYTLAAKATTSFSAVKRKLPQEILDEVREYTTPKKQNEAK